jgi:hypothetical protein
MSVPMGVPGPTLVNSSLFSTVSIADSSSALATTARCASAVYTRGFNLED